jgi:hypothetical protein
MQSENRICARPDQALALPLIDVLLIQSTDVRLIRSSFVDDISLYFGLAIKVRPLDWRQLFVPVLTEALHSSGKECFGGKGQESENHQGWEVDAMLIF